MNQVKYLGFGIQIYDLERLLIEVVRNKKNMDFNLYSKIILGYKKIVRLLNKNKLGRYVQFFKDPMIMYRIENEVYR